VLVVSTQPIAVQAAPPPPAPVAPTTPAVATLASISEAYEGDPSVYSLDRAAKVGGITLRLLGVQRLAAAFVLKVEVTNDSDSDFYVKDFAVQVAAKTAVSKAYFRILVESQRTREGFVVFHKPQPGAAVKIQVNEEGGRGRAVAAQVPYPF
jgi:hypothetical protein